MRYFFLTDGNDIRDPHMVQEFPGITPVLAPKGSKHLSMSHGFSTILDLACRQREFEPFVILENDVKKTDNFTENLKVPSDADLVYIGITAWGLENKDAQSGNRILYLENYDENFVRIHNMVSMHGIMICSIRGLLAYQRAMVESFFRNMPTDIPMAHMQPFLNVYACRRPMVYQWASIGGEEQSTHIELVDTINNPVTTENINPNHFTTRIFSLLRQTPEN